MNQEERSRILSLLEEGKINAEEAARLLDAVAAGAVAPPAPTPGGGKVHVQVIDVTTGATRVHCALPAALARLGLQLAASTELSEGLAGAGISPADLERVQEAVAAGTVGTVLEVEDPSGGYRVEVWIE